MRLILASFAVVVLAVGCSKSKEAPKPTGGSDGSGSATAAGSGSAMTGSAGSGAVETGSGSGSGSAAGQAIADFESPTDVALKTAFDGKRPTLPMLSKDGALVLVDLSEPLSLTDKMTYVVGVLDGKKRVETLTLVDMKAADAEEVTVTDKLKADAAALLKRISEGGYTTFEKSIDRTPEDEDPVALGALGKLEMTYGPSKGGADSMGDRALALTIVDAAGKQVVNETIAAAPAGKKEGQCGGEPRLAAVHYDTARKRVLVRIPFMIGGHECEQLPMQYRFWTLP